MFQTLKNAWKITELRKKILYTLFMLLIYRVLCFIPTPGVDTSVIASALERFSLLGFINQMTGADLANYSIMAMGITPYINASIIMQLLCVAIPKLEEMNKQGEEGRKKIAQITRYVTVGLGFVQAVALTAGLGASTQGALGLITIGFCLAAGTALAMWIGERITENGVGNGISLLIFAGIISNFAGTIGSYIYTLFVDISQFPLGNFIGMIVVFLVLIVGVVFVDLGERRVPVQYAKRVVGRKMYGGQSTFLPVKVNMSGVLPIIFAQSIATLPATIIAFTGTGSSSFWTWMNTYIFDTKSAFYIVCYFLLIIAFSYFYATIQFNPIEIANNLKKNGGFIPGFRPGKPTSDFILKVINKITLFGALYLAIVAILPIIAGIIIKNTSLAVGGTSVIIVVGVALETVKSLEAQMLMRHYKGFLE